MRGVTVGNASYQSSSAVSAVITEVKTYGIDMDGVGTDGGETSRIVTGAANLARYAVTIDTENKWSNFALPPIEHIPDINFWHYAGQLNLYQYLLQREGYVPKRSKFRLFLNHLTESGAKLIELPDMQLEIRDIIVEHLLKMVKSSNV